MSLEAIVARMLELEKSYYDLQALYQELIHQHETLKEKHGEKASNESQNS